jgi:hypothetical protein
MSDQRDGYLIGRLGTEVALVDDATRFYRSPDGGVSWPATLIEATARGASPPSSAPAESNVAVHTSDERSVWSWSMVKADGG